MPRGVGTIPPPTPPTQFREELIMNRNNYAVWKVVEVKDGSSELIMEEK